MQMILVCKCGVGEVSIVPSQPNPYKGAVRQMVIGCRHHDWPKQQAAVILSITNSLALAPAFLVYAATDTRHAL